MALTNNSKLGIDLPEWRPVASLSSASNVSFAGNGIVSSNDMRSRRYADPYIYSMFSGTFLHKYNCVNDAWYLLGTSIGIVGSPSIGTESKFVPSQGPKGLLTGTNTSTKLNLDTLTNSASVVSWSRSGTVATITTVRPHMFASSQVVTVTVTPDAAAIALGNYTITVTSSTTFTFTCAGGGASSGTLNLTIGVTVLANQLSNRGDKLGYIIRVIGSSAGGSGKIEERRIVSNGSGATPTVYLDSALSFTPQAGDSFEILSGRIFIIGTGTTSLGIFRYYDIATDTISGNLSITNLNGTLQTSGQSTFIPLDEQYVPSSRFPGEGFVVGSSTYDTSSTSWQKSCLTATSSAAGTLTGQSALGDSNVLSNEYRNFQIRIVEDTGIPTAVGQRRRITSHTAGVSPVYTLASNWTVTPSTTCKYVIENDNDKMIYFENNITTIYNWNHITGVWDTSTWAVRPAVITHSLAYQLFGIDVAGNSVSIDPDKNVRNSHIFSASGVGGTYYIFDIAASSTGSWSSAFSLPISATNLLAISNPVSDWIYVPNANEGRYVYISQTNSNATNSPVQFLRLDLWSKKIDSYSHLRTTFGLLGAVTTMSGCKMGAYLHVDDLALTAANRNQVMASIYTTRPNTSTGEWFQLLITI